MRNLTQTLLSSWAICCKPESRKFAPHVTLARLKDGRLDSVHRFIAAHSLYASRFFEVGRFVLFSSRPSRGGGPYAVEEAYSLGVPL